MIRTAGFPSLDVTAAGVAATKSPVVLLAIVANAQEGGKLIGICRRELADGCPLVKVNGPDPNGRFGRSKQPSLLYKRKTSGNAICMSISCRPELQEVAELEMQHSVKTVRNSARSRLPGKVQLNHEPAVRTEAALPQLGATNLTLAELVG